MATLNPAGAPATKRGGVPWRRTRSMLGVVPFFAYTGLFLLVPTVVVIVGAFQSEGGGFTFGNISAIFKSEILRAVGESLALSAISALIGAAVGAVLAYLLSTANPNGMLRRIVTSASSVLAQFGGIMLAFAFTFTFLARGLVARWLTSLGWGIDANFFSRLPGLTIVYCYFQIPLMIIIFLPAVDGIRPQWREATASLGGSGWEYWRRVVGPLLAPSFLGALLLLFTNALSSFATAAALINLTKPLLTLQISQALTSETGLGAPNLAKAEALMMIVVVAIVMWLYYTLQRRASRWQS